MSSPAPAPHDRPPLRLAAPPAPAAPLPYPHLVAYRDRLDRERERLRDEIRRARVRLTWSEHERRARRALASHDVELLDAIHLLALLDERDDERLVARRRSQLAALDRLRAYTAEAIDGAC